MGIPTYFLHIVRKNRDIIKKISQFKDHANTTIKNGPTQFNNMYLDCNSIIYDIVHEKGQTYTNTNTCKLKYEKEIIEAVCEKIEFYINLINPTHRVLIAFDGVAPSAKIKQQKKRRFLNVIHDKLITELCNDSNNANNANNANTDNTNNTNNTTTWNTAAITPGTTFMDMLSKDMHDYFNIKKNQFYQDKKLNIMISTPNDAGEGEHKIYEYIRNNKKYHDDCTSTIIYGLDADLIMLTLNHLYISKNLYLFRETPHFIQTVDKTLDPNSIYVIDIPLFADIITKEMGYIANANNPLSTDLQEQPQQEPQENTIKNNKLFDYIFICFLLGNDFMPHFPALNIRTNGIDKLLNSYKHVFNNNDKNNETLTAKNKDGKIIINWKNFRKYIDVLGTSEHEWIKQEYKLRDKQEKQITNNHKKNENENDKRKQLEFDILNLPMRDRSIEKFINPFDHDWEYRYYNSLFQIRINDNYRKEICINYLEGLEWTMNYYSGDCIDWRWTYKYNYPPLLCDLKQYVPYFNTHLLSNKEKNPISAQEQLNHVLPEDLKNSLINNYIKVNNNNELSHYSIKWAFCKYIWEGHLE